MLFSNLIHENIPFQNYSNECWCIGSSREWGEFTEDGDASYNFTIRSPILIYSPEALEALKGIIKTVNEKFDVDVNWAGQAFEVYVGTEQGVFEDAAVKHILATIW